MMQVTTRCAGLAVALVATSASAEPLTKRGDAARRAALALGATTVEVDDGQTLTEADLLVGLFDGQAFALDADTTFNINFGGVIGTVGDASIDPGAPFDFGGATVNLNDGGRFRSTTSPSIAPRSVVSNLTLNYFAGGASGRGMRFLDGSVVQVLGGSMDEAEARNAAIDMTSGFIAGLDAAASDLTVSGGTFGFLNASQGSLVEFTGGAFFDDIELTDSTLHFSGGVIDAQLRASTGSVVNITGGDAGRLGATGGEINLTGGSIRDFSAASNATLNIAGGVVGQRFAALTGARVVITGGSVGPAFEARDGSAVEITGGVVGQAFDAQAGSVVSLSGGRIGGALQAEAGSALTITGADFELDGAPVTDLSGGLPAGATLTGVLADGSVFIFSSGNGARIDLGTTTLNTVAVAPADTTPIVVDSGQAPAEGLRAGQTLTLSGTGTIAPHFSAVDATININGGLVRDFMQVARSTVSVTGGEIESIHVLDGSVLDMSGGDADRLTAFEGGAINLTGGDVFILGAGGGEVDVNAADFAGIVSSWDGGVATISDAGGAQARAADGGRIDIAGGRVGVDLRDGGEAFVTGGNINHFAHARAGSSLTLTGGEFTLDGVAVSQLDGGLPAGALLTGTLADGSVFVLEGERPGSSIRTFLAPGTTTLDTVALAPADPTPIVVDAGEGPRTGLRAGQTLTLTGDGSLGPFFAAVGATLNIDGGEVGSGLRTVDSTVNVSGGVIDSSFRAYRSEVQITGGLIDVDFQARDHSTVAISGGTVHSAAASGGAEIEVTGGDINSVSADAGGVVTITGGAHRFIGASGEPGNPGTMFFRGGDLAFRIDANSGGVIDISGGRVSGLVVADADSVISISGGEIASDFRARAGSRIDLFVTQVAIDGLALDLDFGETIEITQRGGALLEATLLDGQALDFTLNGDSFGGFPESFDPLATLTVTYIPTPGAATLLALAGVLTTRRRR